MTAVPLIGLPLGLVDAVCEAGNLPELLRTTVAWLPGVVEAERHSVALLNGDWLEARDFNGEPPYDITLSLPVATTKVGSVFLGRKPWRTHDLRTEPCAHLQRLARVGLRSAMVVPMVSGNECYGTVNIGHFQAGCFTQAHVDLVSAIARILASQIRIYRQVEEMALIARTDPLTGASNRRAFLERVGEAMSRARETGRTSSVVLLDLDLFKAINDRFGHSGGDCVLRGVVCALSADLRTGDMLARLGGEEFAVLLDGVGASEAMWFAERYRGVIAQMRAQHNGEVITCTASFGVTAIGAADGAAEDLLRRADAALYLAKDNGRNRVEVAA